MEYGYDCIYMAFPLGLAGAIYKPNSTALTEQLGVPKTEACTMLNNLQMHAITTSSSVEDIWKHVTGTKLEREKEADYPPPPPFYIGLLIAY